MSGLPPLLKAQFDEGLRVRRPKPTQDFYKHIYVNSNERINQRDSSSDVQIFLTQPIEIPPDGTTYLSLHRASVPYTFDNIVYPVGFKLSMVGNNGAEIEVRYVILPSGFYLMADLVQTLNDCLNNVNKFATPLGPNNGNNSPLYSIEQSGHYLRVSYVGGAAAGCYPRITFMTYTNFAAAVDALNAGTSLRYLQNTWANEIRDGEFNLLSKRTFGFDNLQPGVDISAIQAASTVLVSPDVFGPFQEFEIFLRISGFPINYDMIDAGTGAPSDILGIIPLNVDTFGSVMSLGKADSLRYVLPPNAKLQKLNLRLTYRDNTQLINLKGQDFSCIISIIKENSEGA